MLAALRYSTTGVQQLRGCSLRRRHDISCWRRNRETRAAFMHQPQKTPHCSSGRCLVR